MAENEQEPDAADSDGAAGSASTASGSDARDGRLSALGSLFAGIAALLALIASTYVAVVTYKQDDADRVLTRAEAQAAEAREEQVKASRVLIHEDWDKGSLEIENRNLDAVQVDFLKELYTSAPGIGGMGKAFHDGWYVGGALPACTILSMYLSQHVGDATHRTYTYTTSYLKFSIPGGREHWVVLPNEIPLPSSQVTIANGANPPNFDAKLNMRESVTYRAMSSRRAQSCK
ncbi:hypothetical protein RKD19_002729 [Streptomyces canus]|uniref:hypothetical protein n=1 Tax=unclassified Streptomyces TaxID=2593676 RepID=UPI0037A8D67F